MSLAEDRAEKDRKKELMLEKIREKKRLQDLKSAAGESGASSATTGEDDGAAKTTAPRGRPTSLASGVSSPSMLGQGAGTRTTVASTTPGGAGRGGVKTKEEREELMKKVAAKRATVNSGLSPSYTGAPATTMDRQELRNKIEAAKNGASANKDLTPAERKEILKNKLAARSESSLTVPASATKRASPAQSTKVAHDPLLDDDSDEEKPEVLKPVVTITKSTAAIPSVNRSAGAIPPVTSAALRSKARDSGAVAKEEDEDVTYEVGDLVDAVWTEDGQWYAAEIKSVNKADGTFEVLFTEYGNAQEGCTLQQLRLKKKKAAKEALEKVKSTQQKRKEELRRDDGKKDERVSSAATTTTTTAAAATTTAAHQPKMVGKRAKAGTLSQMGNDELGGIDVYADDKEQVAVAQKRSNEVKKQMEEQEDPFEEPTPEEEEKPAALFNPFGKKEEKKEPEKKKGFFDKVAGLFGASGSEEEEDEEEPPVAAKKAPVVAAAKTAPAPARAVTPPPAAAVATEQKKVRGATFFDDLFSSKKGDDEQDEDSDSEDMMNFFQKKK